MEFDIVVGRDNRAEFFSMYWAYGRHFCILLRDIDKKTMLDSGILAFYEVDGNKIEYFGHVESIANLLAVRD